MGCGASTEIPPAAKTEDKPEAALVKMASAKVEEEAFTMEAPDRKVMLEDLFDECDDDGSGALSVDEFAQIFDKKMSSNEEIKNNLNLVDTDQADGKLTKEEFVKYHLQKFSAVDDGLFVSMIGALMAKAEDEVVIDDKPAVAEE